jgi:membrane protein
MGHDGVVWRFGRFDCGHHHHIQKETKIPRLAPCPRASHQLHQKGGAKAFMKNQLPMLRTATKHVSCVSVQRMTGLLRDGFLQWWEHNAFQLAAALAYYTVFSLTPLLTIAIAIAALVFGQEAAQNHIVGGLRELIGDASAKAIQDTIRASANKSTGSLAAIIGAFVLFLGAAGVVGQLQQSLNFIWGVKVKSGWKIVIRDRMFSFALVLAIGFLLLISLVVTTILSALTAYFSALFLFNPYVWQIIDTGVSFAFVTVLFGIIYKILPDVQLTWRDVATGATITSLLFTAGKFLIGFYLGHATFSSTYGAAGSLITLLVWVYYSALIFFFGAEITQVYATRYGSGVVPTPLAKPAIKY